MNRNVIGALMLLAIGGLTVGGYKLLSPWLTERAARQELDATSDAKGAALSIRIGGDGYLGYWFLNSPDMRKAVARNGIAVQFEDDGGAYADRLKKFANKELDMIVLPISSYLQHGATLGFPGPGTIIAAISESKGADGIVGYGDKFPQGTVQELNDAALKVAYTADSPSTFLLDLTISDFDMFNLASSESWRSELPGVDKVLQAAKARQGDAFVLWEPELSKALAEVPGLKLLWGSDKFSGYIIDVLVVNREFLRNHGNEVHKFLESYFMTQRSYGNNRPALVEEMRKSTGLKADAVEGMLGKIDWFDLYENCAEEFGISTSPEVPGTEGVINSIIACTDVLVRSKRITGDPLSGNPYQITNSEIVGKLLEQLPAMIGAKGGVARSFSVLDDAGWARLHEVGTIRVEPISFQSGVNLLDDTGKRQLDKIATMLVNNYPDYRIAIRGHTGAGDEQANQLLSQERADVVRQRLIAVHAVSAERLRAEGKGSTQPPPRKPGENERAYRYRAPRVEFVLLEEKKL